MIRRTMKKLILAVLLVMTSVIVAAQLPAPNAAGASAGHHILRTTNVEAANKFWATLGAEPTALANIQLKKIPGVLLIIGGPRGKAPPPAIPRNHRTTGEFRTFNGKDL